MSVVGRPNTKTCNGCKYFYRAEDETKAPMCGNLSYGDEWARNLTYIHPNRPEWCKQKYSQIGKHGKMFETTQQQAAMRKEIEEKQRKRKMAQQWKKKKLAWAKENFNEQRKEHRKNKAEKDKEAMLKRREELAEKLLARQKEKLPIPPEISALLNKIYLTKDECYDKILELTDREMADYCYEMIKVEKFSNVDLTEYHPIMLDNKMYFGMVDFNNMNIQTLNGHAKIRTYRVDFYNDQPCNFLYLPSENILPKVNKNLYVEIGGIKIFTIGRFEYDKNFKKDCGGKPAECVSCGEQFKEPGSRMVACPDCHSVLCLDCLVSLQDEQELSRNECPLCGHEMWTKII